MPRFAVITRPCALFGLVALAACSSLNLGTAAKLRALDYLNDDIASLSLALDVPLSLEPVPEASLLRFDLSVPGHGERHVSAVLVRGDASAAAGALPPPQSGRTYYLFAFSEVDQAALREAQAWARGLAASGVAPARPTVAISPRLCANAPGDPREQRISVLVALPGSGAMAPLLDDARVADLLVGTGSSSLPPCAGHSG